MRWRIRSAQIDTREYVDLLKDCWEPFGVTISDQGTWIYFKKTYT